MKQRFSQIYFGWYMLLMGSILSGLGGGIYRQGASLFFLPIASEFGLSRASASAAAGIGSLSSGIMFSLAGAFSDRFGPKWVIAVGVFLASTGFALMNFVTSMWGYYIVWGLIIGAGMGLGFSVAHDKILIDWFIRKRGLALGSRFAVAGVIQACSLLLVGFLLAKLGWRITCLVAAGIIFGFGALVALRFVRQRRPEYYGLLPDGAKMEGQESGKDAIIAKGVEYAAAVQETEFTFKEATRTPSYWILGLLFMLHGVIFQSISLHSIPFLTDMGINPIAATGMIAMMVLFTLPARFLGGLVADRIRKDRLKFLLSACFLVQAIGISVFLLKPNLVTVYVFLIVFGLGEVYTPLDASIKARYFGRKAYGSIQGISVLFSLPVALLAPIYVGRAFDVTGNYITVFTLFVGLALFSAVLTCMIPVPKLQPTTRINIARRCRPCRKID